jgi:hypothetical protein
MKYPIVHFCALLCLFIPSEGCIDETVIPEVQLLQLTVRVLYDSSYSKIFADSARVIVRNNQETTVDTIYTDTTGTAVFRQLIPGTFDFSVRKILFPDQMFLLTGNAVFKPLNAAKNGLRIVTQPDTIITFRFPK